MSKTTFAIIAGVSAASGAALTAAVLGSSSSRGAGQQQRNQNSPAVLSSSSTTTMSTMTGPPAPLPRTPLAAAAMPPVDPSGIYQYGFPGPKADLRTTLSTVSAYDRRTRNPHWVAEHITPESLAMRGGDRRHSSFAEDDAIPSAFRARLADYHRSGYDRGHQVPAADAKWSQSAMDSTFLLSNMCPQVGDGFNRDYWAHFEDFCRRLTNRFPSVRIVTGPLYLPRRDTGPSGDGKWRVSYEVVGNPPNVSVPTHFFKVIYAEDGRTGGNVSLGAFVLPNAPIANDKPLTDFEVPVEAVERASGLDFTGKLPRERTRKLCHDVTCSLIVRQYNDRQKDLRGTLPPPPSSS